MNGKSLCVARCSAREAMKQRVGGGRKEGTAAVLGGAERGGGENSGGMTERLIGDTLYGSIR